ncbi:MAG: hypothetical protein ACOYXC_20340 [Candidatus Rifleibacteriota bacterium]
MENRINQPETCVNQTVLIWAVVVIVEIFIIAYLLPMPFLILAGFIMYGPIKAAMNWPIPTAIENDADKNAQNKPQNDSAS